MRGHSTGLFSPMVGGWGSSATAAAEEVGGVTPRGEVLGVEGGHLGLAGRREVRTGGAGATDELHHGFLFQSLELKGASVSGYRRTLAPYYHIA